MTHADEAVRLLLDRQAIADVLVRYCFALDDRSWEQLSTCFSPDARLSYDAAGLDWMDFDRFLSGPAKMLAALTSTQHLLGNVVVAVTGDLASSRSYVQGTHVDAEGDIFTTGGFYEDQFVRTADGWRISQRRFVSQFRGGSDESRQRMIARYIQH